ncbi:MAG: MOSC domain-containing protein, partial [Bdellovibrio sp.]|nr:MOSC domain-containing protein [Bdellovibrio sp.]
LDTVTVWADSFLAGIESDEINQALSDFLKQPVKLVRYQKESFRDLKEAGTDLVRQTRFADARPLLLTNENSIADLNEKLAARGLPTSRMERFRSNIIITELAAFSEDLHTQLQIGEVKLMNPKLCARCVIITQDENTGQVVSKETLGTLANYRKVNGNKVNFGVDWTPANGGSIRIGDSLFL